MEQYDPYYTLTIQDVTRNNLLWNNVEENENSPFDLSDATNLCRANESSDNPLFAHRWRSGDEIDIVENWMQDKDIGFDGYYLAQRSGDVSRTPLFLEEDEEIEDMTVYDLHGDMEVFVATAWPVPDDLPNDSYFSSFRYALTSMGYIQGSQDTEGPLYIALINQWKDPITLGENPESDDPRVDIELESGDILTIHLPVEVTISDGDWIAFWVTGDGSTYYAHTSQEATYPYSDVSLVFDMDSWYASRWFDDNLARGAFDARLAIAGGAGYELAADSPAINAGSKDWLSGGTTSTENDILEGVVIPDPTGTNPNDNPPPIMLGDFDNQDAFGDVKSWEDEDSNTYDTLENLIWDIITGESDITLKKEWGISLLPIWMKWISR